MHARLFPLFLFSEDNVMAVVVQGDGKQAHSYMMGGERKGRREERKERRSKNKACSLNDFLLFHDSIT